MSDAATLTRLTDRLYEALWSNDGYSLLPGCGWNDGGCRMLAHALDRLLDGYVEHRLVSIVAHGVTHHVLVELFITGFGPLYLDGDGLSDGDDLLLRWETEELVPDPEIVDFDERAAQGIPNDEHTIDAIAAFLAPLIANP